MSPDQTDHPLESPWFYLLVFSLMALAAVIVIGPKFMHREARLEQKFEARVRAAQPRDAEQAEEIGERGGGTNSIVTVAPLAGVLGVLAAVAWIQWTRERARWIRRRKAAETQATEVEKAGRAS